MNAECPLNVWFVTLILGAKPHWFIPQDTQRVFKRDGIFGDYHSGVPRNRHFCYKERMYGPNETKKWRLSPNLKPWKNWRIRDWSSYSSCCTFRTACPSSTIITISTWLELQPPNQLLVCSPFSIGKKGKKHGHPWDSLALKTLSYNVEIYQTRIKTLSWNLGKWPHLSKFSNLPEAVVLPSCGDINPPFQLTAGHHKKTEVFERKISNSAGSWFLDVLLRWQVQKNHSL